MASLLIRRPVPSYIALALGLSWLVWIPGSLAAPGAAPVVILGAFGPAVAGAIMVRAHGDRIRDWLRGMVIFRVRLRWYAVALLLPLLQPIMVTSVAAAGGASLAVEDVPALLPLFAATLLYMLLLGGGQEEPGWRGYLLPALQGRVNPLAASLVIGAVWALWHVPLFVVPTGGAPAPSLAFYVPSVLAMSIVFTWLYNRSGGSVVLPMLLHASFNAGSTLAPIADPAAIGRPLELALTAAVAGAFVLVAAVVVAVSGTRLGAAQGRQGLLVAPSPGDGGDDGTVASCERRDVPTGSAGR